MKYRNLAVTAGLAAALTVGLYPGAGAQGATCTIGSDTGPGVPVVLAAQSESKPAASKPAAGQDQSPKPAPADKAPAGQAQKDQKPATPTGAAPIVPKIAPDEGC